MGRALLDKYRELPRRDRIFVQAAAVVLVVIVAAILF